MKNIMIETSRLILREFVPEDLAGLYCLYEESDTQFLEPLTEKLYSLYLWILRLWSLGGLPEGKWSSHWTLWSAG